MRFMALLLTVLTVGVAMNAPTQDICGMWVADLSKCDRGPGTQPTRLILNVTRDGNRLKVIEVTSDEVGSSVAERLYIFEGALRRGEKGVGTVATAHRVTVLRWSGRFERWSISESGDELIVNRSAEHSPTAPRRRLILRRSSGNVE
jgi:hypothetical protein